MQRNHHSYIRNCGEVVKRLTLQKFQACYCRIRTLTNPNLCDTGAAL